MICSPGDTVLVPFPFVERPIAKVRPAVTLSARAFNDVHGQTVLAMVTTGAGSAWPCDVPLIDLVPAGLSHASVVRMKTFTLPNALLYRSLGRLSQTDRDALRTALRTCFALH